ncbi:MAG: hypothetical protein WAW88_04020 [Nocardioides sp.]
MSADVQLRRAAGALRGGARAALESSAAEGALWAAQIEDLATRLDPDFAAGIDEGAVGIEDLHASLSAAASALDGIPENERPLAAYPVRAELQGLLRMIDPE